VPAPFRPVTIPLVSGVRQDVATFAASPEQLAAATDVAFTKQGAVRGRPGAVSRDAQVQSASGLLADLTTATTGLTRAGLVSVPLGNDEGPDSPIALYQSAAFTRRGSLWQDIGPHWSMRVTRSPGFTVARTVLSPSRQAPCPAGTSLVGVLTSQGTQTGFPFVNARGEVFALATGSTANFDAVAKVKCVAVDNALFYCTAGGTPRIHLTTTVPATTD
jgi:hypothetical protein